MSQQDQEQAVVRLQQEAIALEDQAGELQQQVTMIQRMLALAESAGDTALIASHQEQLRQTQQEIAKLTEAAQKRKQDAAALFIS